MLKLADLETAITDQTAVVSLMWANNETGVLFPVERIAEICCLRGVLYHCDAVQAAGNVEIDVRKTPLDCLSLTGHKFHAPKGIGALYVRRNVPFSPHVHGRHQERNRRGGTESVALLDKEGICASSGSACLDDSDEPSHVIKAMKPNTGASRQMTRFSLGAGIQKADVTAAVPLAVGALRG